MITQEMKDKGIRCKGKGFNCPNCKDRKECVDAEYNPLDDLISSFEDAVIQMNDKIDRLVKSFDPTLELLVKMENDPKLIYYCFLHDNVKSKRLKKKYKKMVYKRIEELKRDL